MSEQNREILKQQFTTGATITQEMLHNLIDSVFNREEDGGDIKNLSAEALSEDLENAAGKIYSALKSLFEKALGVDLGDNWYDHVIVNAIAQGIADAWATIENDVNNDLINGDVTSQGGCCAFSWMVSCICDRVIQWSATGGAIINEINYAIAQKDYEYNRMREMLRALFKWAYNTDPNIEPNYTGVPLTDIIDDIFKDVAQP